MSERQPDYDPLRPIAPQMKWVIVGVAGLLLGAWEMVFHIAFMGLPMITGHRLNALIAAGLVTLVIVASFLLIQQYEQQLAAAVRELQRKNDALRDHEVERDLRLLELSRDLALALVDINNKCDIALTYPKSVDSLETLAEVKARATELYEVQRALVELERQGAALIDYLPAILGDYQRHRELQSARMEVAAEDTPAGDVPAPLPAPPEPLPERLGVDRAAH